MQLRKSAEILLSMLSLLVPFTKLSIALILLEFLFSARIRWANYDWKESLTSLGVKYVRLGATMLYATMFGPLFAWFYQNRIFTFEFGPIGTAVFYFFLVEFVYYCTHRFCHEYRLGWASHATHHTLTKLNLTSAGRVEVTSPLSLYFFSIIPLIWLGVNPLLFGAAIAQILIFQSLIHTDLIPRIPLLDTFINTPSNHRVHHGTQEIYYHKNYGGITVIFDRIFGTYQSEIPDMKPHYGIVGIRPSYNPLYICVVGWIQLFRRH